MDRQAVTDELAGWLRFALTPVSPARQRSLLAAFGLPGNIFAQPHSHLAGVAGHEAADALLRGPSPEALETTLAWAGEDGNHILTLADAAYPQSLLEIADPPPVLYVKGNSALFGRPTLAIVGSRAPTARGEADAEAFASSLGAAGLTIISGLAHGIDAAAHRGALAVECGSTIAVIGTGIDRIYPARNAALAREIAARGAIISEFPLGTPPARWNFPRRNRLIAGLSLGVLVVEATLESGSLITARLAADAGREVFAIPGSIHSPQARGCHRLIREGAKLVETAEDVFEELRGRTGATLPRHVTLSQRMPSPLPPRAASQSLPIPAHLAPEAIQVLEALGCEPRDIDTLALATGLAVEALHAHLLTLELEGLASRQTGGGFLSLHARAA
ncbi:DNA-processing protein DprA [Azonexus sp.]|jgi:DNA processing protein|uniref:DNA-processing protein DprA n=1 Tax=Azonexus sp. TaxID=1872668 RepID=UPI002826594D|nr:DNA-processing protein DprA [Azonexus sp.]MDR1994761.1 DNA-processing protein DprA [Azonexus sp.]